MKTNSKELNEKNSGLVVLYYNGEPITLQCPDSKKLKGLLLELHNALADAFIYYCENGYLNIAKGNLDLRNILNGASKNMTIL